MKPLRCLLGRHRWHEQPGPVVRDHYRQWWLVCERAGCTEWKDQWRPARNEDAPLITRVIQQRIMAGLGGIKAVEGPPGEKAENLT